jgi:hypothetical protein
LHVVTPVGPVVAVLQVVAVHEFVLSAMPVVHEADGVGPVNVVPGQVVVVQKLPAFAPLPVHDEAPIGPTLSTGQDVVVKPLPAFGPEGTHDPEGVLLGFGVQVVAVQKLAAVAGPAEQLATPVLGVLFVLHVVVV